MSLLGAAATLAAAVVVAAIIALFLYFGPGPAARAGKATDLVLSSGAHLPQIAAELKDAGVIRSTTLFVAAAELTGAARRLKAGEYLVASRASMASVLDAIREGRVLRRFITVPEGVTSEAVLQILTHADYLAGVAPAPPEGAVLPETYEVERGEDRAAVLQRMMDARDTLLAALWSHRRADLPYRTPEEAVILASIVEKETALAGERPRIAAVFVNRLKTGMRLESDPTVIYGLTGGRPLGHGLRVSELASQTPYNTYQVSGLPPTPIANPGRASLAAALDPPRTAELYFVADGGGGHAFSANIADHLRNVAKWRSIEAARTCPAPTLGVPARAC
jgi:UPF0755 protein